MTRYLIAGGHGMLAHDLRAALEGREVTVLGREQLDITDLEQVRKHLAGHDIVINAAAYTAVDAAEADEERATVVNAGGAENLARAAAEVCARFVQLSTDYVFPGTATSPYPEDTPRAPINAYGRSKAEGERRVAAIGGDHLIVRTSWLYGLEGPSFPRTMAGRAAQGLPSSVVDDQFGQLTWTADLARGIVAMLDADAPSGIYHASSRGQASWFDIARHVYELVGAASELVQPTDSAASGRPAARPGYSVLGHDTWIAAGIPELPHWRDALDAAARAGVLEPR